LPSPRLTGARYADCHSRKMNRAGRPSRGKTGGHASATAGWFVNEAPVHEICLLYAAQVCPYLSSPWHRMGDEFRAGQRREERISLVGFERTSQVLALRSGLQQDLHTLHFKQEGVLGEVSYSRPGELADRYAALLADEEVPALSHAEAGLVGLFNEHSDEGAAVTGAALMAGASFLKNVFRVQGMATFARTPAYRGMALQFLDLQKLAELGEGSEDPASRFSPPGCWSASTSCRSFSRDGGKQGTDSPDRAVSWHRVPSRRAAEGLSRRMPPVHAGPGAGQAAATRQDCNRQLPMPGECLDVQGRAGRG